MNTYTEENYLKALFNLTIENGETTVNDLSKELNIKMPTVNSMIKKLAEKNMVNYTTYKPISLTDKGKREAALVIRKHRLTEMFLVEKMGFGWDEVHDIAEQIEHIHAPKFFSKMDEILNFPTIDPHGSPIPDKQGKVAWIAYEKLLDCKEGDTIILSAVTNSSDEFLKFLNKKNLLLGSELKIIAIEPFDESVTVMYKKSEITISKIAAEKLLVKTIAK